MPKHLRNVLVTVRPYIAGRESRLSVALSFVELDAVFILHSFATEEVECRSDGEVDFSARDVLDMLQVFQ